MSPLQATAGNLSAISPFLPTFPDFALCDPWYGNHLSESDARRAIANMPRAQTPQDFRFDQPSQPWNLPFVRQSGIVSVQIDYAGAFAPGSSSRPPPVEVLPLIPDQLVGMAENIIAKCIQGTRGSAGFQTLSIEDLIAYVADPDVDITRIPYPAKTNFITVTIGNTGRRLPPPGNFDAAMAVALQMSAAKAAKADDLTASQKAELESRAKKWERQLVVMRGLLKTWWDFSEYLVSTM